jgi:hypothetical protein
MFCPLCGNKLIPINKPNYDCDCADFGNNNCNCFDDKLSLLDRLKKLILSGKIPHKQCDLSDQSEWYKCSCGSFGEDYPLIMHHPYGGLDSQPGDSWSLTWVK